jgi:hypothetical protein
MSAGRPIKPIRPEVAQRTCEQMRAGDPASARAHLDSKMRMLRAEGIPIDE